MEKVIEYIPEFESRIKSEGALLQKAEGPKAYGPALLVHLESTRREFETLLGHISETLADSPKADSDELMAAYAINFEWIESAKAYLLLGRDSLIELTKGMVGQRDGRFEASQVNQLVEEGKKVSMEAIHDLTDQLGTGLAELQTVNSKNRRKLATWRKQKNPWPLYQKQFQEIIHQAKAIWDSLGEMSKVADCFSEARKLVLALLDDSLQVAARVKKLVGEAAAVCTELMKENPEKNLGKMASKLEDYEASLDLPNLLAGFNPKIEECLEKLPEELEFPMGIKGGMVEMRQIYFQRRAQTWLKSEVLPLIYEIWELAEESRTEARMTFINLQNWAIMLSQEIKEGKDREVEPSEFIQLATDLGKRLEKSANGMKDLSATVRQRMDADFHLHLAYARDRNFLPVELQSTIEQLRLNQDKVFESVRNSFNGLVARVRLFVRQVEKEEALSTSEKVIRFLQEREPDPANAQYASIFLTKGFVSTSFNVGREDELEHAQRTIANWRQGYRGSLLLTGQRLCGKSLFGELIATRCFDHRTIRLHPNSLFTVEGRKHETTCDLTQALEQIRRHTLSKPTLIWIDDFENWWDVKNSYLKNAQGLKHFMENQGSKSFVMVAMGNTLRPRLDKLLDWNQLFLAQINLDRMPATDIREAILIRHSATHQKLVNEFGEELSPQEFKKLTQAIYSSSGGNIGEALNTWSYSTRYVGEDAVTNVFKNGYDLPDLLDNDLGILLSTIMMQRRSNESRLRARFGPAFSPKYAMLIRRMLSTGVLLRGIDGWLEVNPVLVNDLGNLLHRKRFLRYKN